MLHFTKKDKFDERKEKLMFTNDIRRCLVPNGSLLLKEKKNKSDEERRNEVSNVYIIKFSLFLQLIFLSIFHNNLFSVNKTKNIEENLENFYFVNCR